MLNRMAGIALLMLGIITLLASPAKCQTAGLVVQGQSVLVENEKPLNRGLVDGYHYTGEKFGLWGFAAVEKEYFSAVAGPMVDLFSVGDATFTLGVGAGIERFADLGSYQNFARYGAFLSLEKKDTWLVSFYYENGESKYEWMQADVRAQVASHLALGVLHQTDDGTGPRAILKLPKLPIELWGGPMWGKGDRKVILGLDINFEK